MKRLLTCSLLLLIVASTFAQDGDCKYDKNELDKFTHKKIVYTRWENLTTALGQLKEYVPSVRCVQEDTLRQLIIYVDGSYYSNFKPTKEEIDSARVIPAGSKIVFLMEDQKSLELVTAKLLNSSGEYVSPYTGENRSEKFKVYWHIPIYYPLDNKSIKALAVQGVTAMRVYYKSDKYTDYNIHKRKYDILQHLMTCITAQGN